ncbi:uncharacterized protein PHACADRAFT_182091 [Phanerochaete carnosa HHB-10118-sp]|uniref:Protoporphyrinogen oxidase n=1 Tax=Phanerochaete carnosa (strain HHB-10118-sp) TaxID=650164 RepID=K5V4M0_PHACS|nr:uncharacterized protein PHACADRAFT_182091 [Phanerochaete carnosa HHB-10118-sp]EKM57571.1 hypothetical protein PHACADRAFT_182091 [Phanerochaete carnosa HHB-10118-sp]
MPAPTHISVIGGGLSGLSSAYHLSRRFPTAKVTLLEQSPRLGGWVHSERVHVQDDKGNEAGILLERGPRTLRPNSKAVLELINLLELQRSLLVVPKTAAAARTRFLHIPGTRGLTALPSSVTSLLATPLGRAIALAGAREPLRSYPSAIRLAAEDGDESLHEFLSTRLGPELARVLGSALVHGIYAADSKLLSVRAAFPSLWGLAEDGRGSILRGVLSRILKSRSPEPSANDYDLGEVPRIMQTASIFSFEEGMTAFAAALEKAVIEHPNTEILKNDKVDVVQKDTADGDVTIRTQSGRIVSASHLVSAMPLPALHTLLERSSLPSLPHLTANPTSSVIVVNVVFPPTPPGQPIHPTGFGYLIPRDQDWNASVLGTVFDACALGGQDTYPSVDAPKFTKMTMMIRAEPSAPPVTQDAVLAYLTEHLAPAHPLPRPVYFSANIMHECIPTPIVGHVQRMKELRNAVWREWGERLDVIGAGVGGVSPIHPTGFGYLIPRDQDWNASVLGTVFDACALGGQDTYPSVDAPKFTKMTMMIRAEPSAPPVTQDAVLAYLTEHLAPAHPLPRPVYFSANIMHECIPTPIVGHVQRMKELRNAVWREWGERLDVIGAGVGGVSVGDCIEQGRQVGRAWDH